MRPGAAQFRPNALVTRQEAVIYALRAAGLSDLARSMATALADGLPADTPLETAWALGYLQQAQAIGMISTADFDAARADIFMEAIDVIEGVETSDENGLPIIVIPVFQRNDPATREEVAYWFYRALRFARSGVFTNSNNDDDADNDSPPPPAGISLQSFTDWQTVTLSRVNAVETMLRHNVITGQIRHGL
jgi:hypothetical protein